MKQKNSYRFFKIFYGQKALAVLGMAILILISFPLAKNVSQRHKLNSEIGEMQKEIEKIESKNNNLRKLIDYFSSNQFVEEQARLNFNLKKQGENVIVVKNRADEGGKLPAGGSSAAPTSTDAFGLEEKLRTHSPQKAGGGNPSNWIRYFLKK